MNTRLERYRALAGRGRKVLRDERGVTFDVGSLMVGALIAGFLAAAILGTLFAVIPWSQNQSAKTSISGIATAQETYYAYSADFGAPSYGTMEELRGKVFKSGDPEVAFLNPQDGLDEKGNPTVLAAGDATQWVIVAESMSGDYFWAHNNDTDPQPLKTTSKPANIDAAMTAALSQVQAKVGSAPPAP